MKLKLALRSLLRTPVLTLVAVVSLALGIGANSAIFSLFDQLLLDPLPVDAPRQLVNLEAPGPKSGSTSCNSAGGCDEIFSYPMFRDLEREQTALSGLAAHRVFGANLAYDGTTISEPGMYVSGSYFPTLGLAPAVGRLLGPQDDVAPGEPRIAVLAHDAWTTRFGSNTGIVGDTIVVNGEALTVVGVAPAGFRGTTFGVGPALFVPITLRSILDSHFPAEEFEERRNYWVYLFGRLADGVTVEQAEAALNLPYSAILRDVEAPLQEGTSEATLEKFVAKKVEVVPGPGGQSDMRTESRAPMMLLFAVAGVVLLIACANVANLLLARAVTRGGEMAIRVSVGANRRQLLSQLMTEALVLAAAGGAAGLVTAQWTLKLLGRLLPADASDAIRLAIDLDVVAFTGLLALAVGVLFGLFPALHASRVDLSTVLRAQAGRQSGSRSAQRFRLGLVVGQIALSTALLAAAVLFTRSLVNVSRAELGYEKIEQLVTFGISPELNGYEPDRSRQLFVRLEEELASIPGVTGVTASLVPVLANSNWGSSVTIEGIETGPDDDVHTNFTQVGPGYFRTMGIPLLRGRGINDQDLLDQPRIAVVNEAFVRKFELGNDVLGRRFAQSVGDAVEFDTTIVGVVADAKYSSVKKEVPPLFFRPYRQNETLGFLNFYVRTGTETSTVLRAIPEVVARLDPNLPVEDLKTLPAQIHENTFMDRFLSTLSASFAGLATILAAVGLYGVLAFMVAQRTREIGLRIALGADRARIRRLVLAQVAALVGVGATLGLLAALGIGRVAQSLLFEVEPADPVGLAMTVALVAAFTFVSAFVPTLRATRVEPMKALRYE